MAIGKVKSKRARCPNPSLIHPSFVNHMSSEATHVVCVETAKKTEKKREKRGGMGG